MVYYFVAYYAEDKSYSYKIDGNKFLPYSPIYRTRYADYDKAMCALRRARHKNRDKRRNIFLDCAQCITTR